MYNNYEAIILDYVGRTSRLFATRPLNLGGISGYSGGVGSPPGGFVGKLVQTRVAYDGSELSSSGIPASGASLLDNLNHIRYRVTVLESGGGSSSISVKEDNVLIASGITVLNFEGGASVANDGGGQVTITVTASGGGGSGISAHSELTELDYASAGHTGFQPSGTYLVTTNNLSDVSSQQTALNNITDVSGATNEYVLTKDTGTGNATWKATASGVGSGQYRQFTWTASILGGWEFVSLDSEPVLNLEDSE